MDPNCIETKNIVKYPYLLVLLKKEKRKSEIPAMGTLMVSQNNVTMPTILVQNTPPMDLTFGLKIGPKLQVWVLKLVGVLS
jgi:hypothetical protein